MWNSTSLLILFDMKKKSAMYFKNYSTITRICQLICSKIPKENNLLFSEAWFVNLFSIIIDFSLTIFFSGFTTRNLWWICSKLHRPNRRRRQRRDCLHCNGWKWLFHRSRHFPGLGLRSRGRSFDRHFWCFQIPRREYHQIQV